MYTHWSRVLCPVLRFSLVVVQANQSCISKEKAGKEATKSEKVSYVMITPVIFAKI